MKSSSLFVTVTHANLKQPLFLARALIFGFYYSEAQACTLVLASGGAMVPVLESVEQMDALLNNGETK